MKNLSPLFSFRAATALATASGAAALLLLSGCGGGGGGGTSTSAASGVTTPPVTTPVTNPGGTPDWLTYANHCERPRAGSSDVQGTRMDELRWLRSYYADTYLWYRELPNLALENYSTPIAYFDAYKTSALTATGRPKDRFHFTYDSATWDAMSSTGAELGYGLSWARNADAAAPRYWTLAQVAPDSPGALAGLRRGDVLVSVDGVALIDNTSGGVDALNAGLFPGVAGQRHNFVLTRAGVPLAVTLTAQQVAVPPVGNVKTIDTPTGKVGYLRFDDHTQLSESELASAISTLKAAAVVDLVLDMRYNGGGYLLVASELAYMVAGPAATAGKVFENVIYNDKTAPQPAQLFQATAYGFPSSQLARGAALPSLGLKRVTILTTPGTCSASESVINGLRGVDVEVNLIGGETCGKPYGFLPAPNCGTTYFGIQLQGTNNKGFGDYGDGFQPTCRATDDFGHELGDSAETLLSAALSYRANGVCPATAQSLRAGATPAALQLVRAPVKEIAIRAR